MRLLGLGFFLLTLSCPGQSHANEPLPGTATGHVDACYAFTPDADHVETTVIRQLEGGEVTLRVPVQYFEDVWDQAGGYTTTSQLFRVEIGSFQPVSRRETGERNKQGIWNWMHFVVGDVVSLDLEAQLAADLFADPRPPLSDYAPRPGPHGLTWLETPFASDQEDPREDVFVHPPPPAALETVIACCSPLDLTSCRYPGCTQHFRAADLDVSVSYRKTELAQWREFQAQITAFLTCATSEAS